MWISGHLSFKDEHALPPPTTKIGLIHSKASTKRFREKLSFKTRLIFFFHKRH